MSEDNVARLVVSFEAKLDNIQKGMDGLRRSVYGAAADTKKILGEVDTAFNKLFAKPNFNKALSEGLGAVRGNLHGMADEVPLVGAGLVQLGIAGLAAGGAFEALHAVLEHTDKAIEYGAQVAKLGKTVGTSTDFIQQFNFAARQSEVDTAAADESLKGLNQSLGLVQSGLARKQLANAFKALGFTPEQLRQYHDVGDFFPVLVERISQVGSEAEKAAIAKRLGISELLPLLLDGANNFNKLAGEARALGIVMDEGLIKKSEEAKAKLNEIDQVMKAKSNITFAQFADTIIAVKMAFLEATEAGLKFLAINTGTQTTKSRLKDLSEQVKGLVANGAANEPAGRSLLAAKVADINALLLKDKIESGVVHPAEHAASAADKATQLVDPKAAGHTRTDRTQAAIEDAQAKEYAAHVQLLQALLAQTGDLEQQLDYSRQITQAEKDKVDAETAKKVAEVAAAKDIKTAAKASLEASIAAAGEEQKRAIDTKAVREYLDLQLAAQKRAAEQASILAGYDQSDLSARAQLATTLKERAALEAEALRRRQAQEMADLQLSYDDKVAHGQASDRDRQMAVFSLMGAQGAERASQSAANAGPVQQYLRSIQDLNTEFQNEGVTAARSLASGLADAAVNAKSFGDVMSNVIKQLLIQAATAALEKDVMGPILMAIGIPGFAGGTNYAPGGVALVGENGPELVNLPQGSRVTPNGALGSVVAGGGLRQTNHFDLRGAMVTEDVMASLMAYTDRKAEQAVIVGASRGHQQTLDYLGRRAANVLGRR